MVRYITYDTNNNETYEKLYEFFKDVDAKMITKSTYLVNVGLEWDKFKKKIENLTNEGDKVYIIYNSVNGIKHYKVR